MFIPIVCIMTLTFVAPGLSPLAFVIFVVTSIIKVDNRYMEAELHAGNSKLSCLAPTRYMSVKHPKYHYYKIREVKIPEIVFLQ